MLKQTPGDEVVNDLMPDCGNTSRLEDVTSTDNNPQSEDAETSGGSMFMPPLYIQRYAFVQHVLADHQATRIVDFGSAECKIVKFLVHIATATKIALVDIDGPLLNANRYLIQPYTCDYLVRRDLPMEVTMYEGSATELDSRIQGFDAVSMVEIIEHLHPDVLSKVKDMVFGQLQPKVVVMTTPNADFNILFPGFSGFRHWDHKFEWSRAEYQAWCKEITDMYPYTVTFDGIGNPPAESTNVGHCSQAAIFVRKLEDTIRLECSECYRLIATIIYPYKDGAAMTAAGSLAMEVGYQLRRYQQYAEYQDSDGNFLVPVSELLGVKKLSGQFDDVDSLRCYLEKQDYKISVDGQHVILSPIETSSSEDETYKSDDENEYLDNSTNDSETIPNKPLEDWDDSGVDYVSDTWD